MYIKVKVLASQKKEKFLEVSKDRFSAAVKEPAERNLANTRIMELAAEHFNISVKKVKIISGHHHPSKILSIDNGK